MVKLSTQSKWKPWMAFVLEALVLLFLAFGGSAMQSAWGIPGLVATELVFLVGAIAVALAHKTPLKEVFPIGKVRARDIFGVLVMAYAGMLFNLIAVGLSMCIVPNSISEIVGLNDFLYSEPMPFIVSVLVIAVMPAICEEAMHRGAILSHLRSLNKDWLIVIIGGLFFGLFHLSPLRFLSTAILGGFLTYLMVKKNNFIFPMLLHFCNNFISSLSGAFSNAANSVANVDTGAVLASIPTYQFLAIYCLLGFTAPFVFVGADSLLFGKSHKKHWALVISSSVAIFVVGIVLMVIATVQSM